VVQIQMGGWTGGMEACDRALTCTDRRHGSMRQSTHVYRQAAWKHVTEHSRVQTGGMEACDRALTCTARMEAAWKHVTEHSRVQTGGMEACDRALTCTDRRHGSM
jgi:hypothetical protein